MDSIDLSNSPHLDSRQIFDLQYHLLDGKQVSADIVGSLPLALWRLAELLWTLCEVDYETSYPVQMKLI